MTRNRCHDAHSDRGRLPMSNASRNKYGCTSLQRVDHGNCDAHASPAGDLKTVHRTDVSAPCATNVNAVRPFYQQIRGWKRAKEIANETDQNKFHVLNVGDNAILHARSRQSVCRTRSI